MNLPLLTKSILFVFLPLTASAHDLSREVPVDKNDPELVFAYQGDAVLTQVGIDAAFTKIPLGDRLLFIRDGGKVDRMVRNIMKSEVIALDAIENGFDQDPEVMERMIQAAYKELASAWIVELAERAPEADYEAMAYEDFLANPKDYQTREYLDITHILIGTKSRTGKEALLLAETVRTQAVDEGISFSELVLEYSDDPGASKNQGSFLRVSRGQMARPFEDAAFELENVGDISAPVLTEFGYHIIRLDKRYEPRPRDFEEVREETVTKMRMKHRSEYQELYIKGLLEEGIVLPEGSVEVMLKRHFGENLENAPQF